MEWIVGFIAFLFVIGWLGNQIGGQVDDSFRKGYKEKYGREPTESEIKQHHDDFFEPHGRI